MSDSREPGRRPGLDPRMVRALDHPIRAAFLRSLAERETLTPVEAIRLLDQDEIALSHVVYHVRVLHDLHVIEAAGDPRPEAGRPFRITDAGADALIALGIPPG